MKVIPMRCLACNKELSDFEATRKSTETGEYIDLCNTCFSTIKNVVLPEEREDLREVIDDNEGEY